MILLLKVVQFLSTKSLRFTRNLARLTKCRIQWCIWGLELMIAKGGLAKLDAKWAVFYCFDFTFHLQVSVHFDYESIPTFLTNTIQLQDIYVVSMKGNIKKIFLSIFASLICHMYWKFLNFGHFISPVPVCDAMFRRCEREKLHYLAPPNVN